MRFSMLWTGVRWFFDNLLLLLAAIGAASVIVRAFDSLVEKAIERHPDSRFWRYLDRALDSGDTVLGFVIDLLHKIALRQKAS